MEGDGNKGIGGGGRKAQRDTRPVGDRFGEIQYTTLGQSLTEID